MTDRICAEVEPPWEPVSFLAGAYLCGRVERSVVHARRSSDSNAATSRLACGRLVENDRLADSGAHAGEGLEVVTCRRCVARVRS